MGDVIDLALPTLLAQARLTHVREIRRRLAAAGFDDMPPAGVRVIGRLARGGTTVGEVAGAYDASKQAASKLVDSLVMRGYVDRVPAPEDRRRMHVVLTERGRAAAREVRAAIDDVDARFIEAVGQRDAYRMRQLLAVLAALDDDGGPEVPDPPAEDAATGYAEGKLCYVELPADDPERAAAVLPDGLRVAHADAGRRHADVRGRRRGGRGDLGDGGAARVATPGPSSTSWSPTPSPLSGPSRPTGGRVVEPVGRHLPEVTARIADPYGNVLGIYQERALTPA